MRKNPLTDHARARSAGLVLCSCLLGLVVGAADPEAAGLVVAVRGDVAVTHADGKAEPLALKSSVRRHDTVRTGDRGRVQITFTDDTVLSLGRNTQIEVTECVFKRSEGQGELALNVTEGVFRVVGGAIMKIAPENFRTDTPTATIGIRGSSFAAEVTAKLTTVVLLGTTGAGITVSNDDGYRIVYIPGSGLSVPRGAGPGPVKSMEGLATALLQQTAVAGSGLQESAAPQDGDGSGAAVDPHSIIRGYRDDTEARAALAAALAAATVPTTSPTTPEGPPRGTFDLFHGVAVGLDLDNGWALRSISPDELYVTVGFEGTQLTSVAGGSMVLHAQGTGDSSDTFPEGPVSAPGMGFTFANGVITGNPGIAVTNGTIQPPNETTDISNWGWWEMDLNDPNDPTESHHAVGLWQATSLVRTATDYVRDRLLGRDFVGSYNGDAHCLRNGIDRFDGSSHLDLDFRQYAFTGGLDFSAGGGPTMGLAGTINTSGIHGRVTGVSGDDAVRSSSTRGFFYGSAATQIQGAFDARTAQNRYIGIFDASGRPAPAPVGRR